MTTGWYVTANDIKEWTTRNKRRAEELLSLLVRKLICASCKPNHLHFPSGDSVTTGGRDGTLKVEQGNEIVPSGTSVWEFGTRKDVNTKVNKDYTNRTKSPGDLKPLDTTFVLVTTRAWKNMQTWCDEKSKEGNWKEVRGINADDLEHWLQQCPAVHRWFAHLIGKHVDGVWDIEQAWESWVNYTTTRLNPDIVLNGRGEESEKFLKLLAGDPKIIPIKADSEKEAYAFCLATIQTDERQASRVLVVKNQGQWDELLDSSNSLILIPKGFVPENMGYAVQKGHFIVHRCDPTDSNREDIILGRMSWDDRVNALKTLGLSREKAERVYEDTRGCLDPILRHPLLGGQEMVKPAWIDQFNDKILLAAFLAGEWEGTKEKDQRAVSALADLAYDLLEEKLSQLASVPDSPIRLVGSCWQIISKLDLWFLMSGKINKQAISRLESVVLDVLGESDPVYDVPCEERWMANVKGIDTQYSRRLKRGLSDTLLLLATFGDGISKNMGNINFADKVSYWVSEFLNKDLSARGWYSFGRNIVALAEAAPESFLQAIESSIHDKKSELQHLFQDEGFLGEVPHSNLLWALETISWNLDYLPAVTRILAKLTEMDPGGLYSNRPFSSLKEIFCGWINNTYATHGKRIQIIDAVLIKFHPNIAWRLMIGLLPEENGGISSRIQKPRYQNWADGQTTSVLQKDYYKYVDELIKRILPLVDDDSKSRWLPLIDRIEYLRKESFQEILNKLKLFSEEGIDDEYRGRIADKLREIISHNREFSGNISALPKEAIDKLEEIYYIFAPGDLTLKYKYLFDNDPPKLINPVVRSEVDFDEDYQVIERLRDKAVSEIYQQEGFKGLKRLAMRCDYAKLVGISIANLELGRDEEKEIFGWLIASENRLIRAAQAYILSHHNKDNNWTKSYTSKGEAWNSTQHARFLIALPFGRMVFGILRNGNEKVCSKYWQEVNTQALKPIFTTYDDTLASKTGLFFFILRRNFICRNY